MLKIFNVSHWISIWEEYKSWHPQNFYYYINFVQTLYLISI